MIVTDGCITIHGKLATRGINAGATASTAKTHVAGNLCIAGHGKTSFATGATCHIYAAAKFVCCIIGNLCIAGHVERAPVAIQIHTAAITFIISRNIAADGTAGHDNRALDSSYTCARISFVIVAADSTSVHGESTFFSHRYAGAILTSAVGDNATGNRSVSARLNRLPQIVLFCIFRKIMLAATAVAVSQRKAAAGRNGNRIGICVCRNAVTIQTKHHVIVRFPCPRCLDILCQIVMSFRCSFQFCFAAYGLPICHRAMLITVCACRAADGMVSMLAFRHRHWYRHRCIQRFRNGIKSCHIQLFTLLLGQFRHSIVDGFQLRTDTFCIFHRHFVRQSIDECLYLLHCCLLLIVCRGILRAGITIADTFH